MISKINYFRVTTLFNKFSGELPETIPLRVNNFREVKLAFHTSRKFLLLSRSSFRELNFSQKLIKQCTYLYSHKYQKSVYLSSEIKFLIRLI
jgi:hypothetical protein